MRLEADLWLDGNRTFLMSRQQRGPGLVAAALLKHFNDRHRQRLLPQSAGELVARRLTTATRLGADPAVLVHAGVALTIGCAGPAGSPAGFDECLGEARIRTGVAGEDRAGCRADSCTIQVRTDALDQFGHHVLGEAGVRTRSAGLRTVRNTPQCIRSASRDQAHSSPSGGTPASAAHATWRSPTDGTFGLITILGTGCRQKGSGMRFSFASVTTRLAGPTTEKYLEGDD